MFDWRPRTQTRGVMLHDSHRDLCTSPLLPWLRVNGRAKGLLEVGYHAVIERSGELWLVRPITALGSHAPGFNHAWIGVCLDGSERAGFTPEQVGSLLAFISYIQSEYPEAPLDIRGHSELVTYRRKQDHPHRCPALDMDELRHRIREHWDMTESRPVVGPDGLSEQNRMVLSYLRRRASISNLIAIVSLGVGSLTSRIAELRKLGFDIWDEREQDEHGKPYKRYFLPEAEKARLQAQEDMVPEQGEAA